MLNQIPRKYNIARGSYDIHTEVAPARLTGGVMVCMSLTAKSDGGQSALPGSCAAGQRARLR